MTVQFATPGDEKMLREICVAAGMDLAGEAEEHLVIKEGSSLIGGAMLAQTDHDAFHLLLIAVDAGYRGRGAGCQLLQKMLRDPWSCCRDSLQGSGRGYSVTTVARGTGAPFYQRNGFERCDFTEIADPYRDQCGSCPEREGCHPVAMRFVAPQP